MSDTTSEIVETATVPVPAAAMTGGELLPGTESLRNLWNLCSQVAGTGFLPQAIRTPEQAFAIALKGRELGLPPMMAFNSIHIIQGKTEMSAQLMTAMLRKGGVSIEEVEVSREAVELVFRRPLTDGREDVVRSRFTIADAKAAGLTGKDNWKKHTEEMLYARATSKAARRIGPDLIHGAYTEGEIGTAQPLNGFTPTAADPPPPPKAPRGPAEVARPRAVVIDERPAPGSATIAPTSKQRQALHAVAAAVGLGEPDVRDMLRGYGSTTGSTGDMTRGELSACLDAVMAVQKSGDPDTSLWEPINAAVERGNSTVKR